VEAALTLEAGYASHFDRTVVVHCSKAEQVRHCGSGAAHGREALRRMGRR